MGILTWPQYGRRKKYFQQNKNDTADNNNL